MNNGFPNTFSITIGAFITAYIVILIPIVLFCRCNFGRGSLDPTVKKKFEDSFDILNSKINQLVIDSARTNTISTFLIRHKMKDSLGIYHYLDSCLFIDSLQLKKLRNDNEKLQEKGNDYVYSRR